jgi:membrane protease YdiL (CAAX protease family)
MSLLEKHPVVSYFVLTILVSWISCLLLLGPGGFPLSFATFERLGPALYAVMLSGPVVASILLTVLLDGRTGLRALLRRLCRWRVGARWYAIALLPAVAIGGVAAVRALLGSGPGPFIVEADDKVGAAVLGVAIALVFGVFEEIGWTGFAVPRLRKRHRAITTGSGAHGTCRCSGRPTASPARFPSPCCWCASCPGCLRSGC